MPPHNNEAPIRPPHGPPLLRLVLDRMVSLPDRPIVPVCLPIVPALTTQVTRDDNTRRQTDKKDKRTHRFHSAKLPNFSLTRHPITLTLPAVMDKTSSPGMIRVG